jgi:tetratricopeptide (TPR) repeat protein
MIPFTVDELFSWIKGKKEKVFDELDIALSQGIAKCYLFYLDPDDTDYPVETSDTERTFQAFNRLINICNTNLDSNPDDLKSLVYRSAAYLRSDKYEDAMIDFNKVAELAPTEPDLYLERARYFQRHDKYSEAISDYSKIIEIDPTIADIYLNRASCHHQNRHYFDAVADYSTAIELSSVEISSHFTGRAQSYDKLHKTDEALSDFNRSIEIEPCAEAYLGRGKIYSIMEDFDTYSDKAIEDFTKSIELDSYIDEAYRLRAGIFDKKGDYDLAEKDYSKCIEINPNNSDAYRERALLYQYSLFRYDDAIKDHYEVMRIGDFKYDTHDTYQEIIEATQMLTLHQAALKNQIQEEKIREEERKKIFSDLSHSIKNLISTVIDPLENLKLEPSVKPQVIENALRGANLIREIVNAVNLSFKGSIDDFRYDATHYTDAESQSLKSIFIAALKHSIGNMFDSKYFGTFMRRYFPDKSLYMEAKKEWSDFSQSNDLNELLPFLHHYFFRTDFVLDNAEKLIIGNQKGSIIKLLILCQELILNAVKYSAFIDKGNRFLRVHFAASDQFVSILVENPFDKKSKVKTSGIGHVIIQNFSQLLDTSPTISNDGGVYSVDIRFGNLWKEAKV